MEGSGGGRSWRVTDDWVFDKFRNVDLADAKVDAIVSEDPLNGTFSVALSTTAPAFYVWANARNIKGEFDDNSFLLLPGTPKTITFTPKNGDVTLEQFKKVLSVRHLRDTYK